MSEENKKKKDKERNCCIICRKNIYEEGNELTACIKMKNNIVICFKCAFEIEYALDTMYSQDEMLFDDKGIEDGFEAQPVNLHVAKLDYKFSHLHFPDKRDVIEQIKKAIIGQNESVERIVNMIYRNYKSENKELKRCPLLIGKSGVGKTEIIKQFCNILQVPYVIENAKDFSEAGYVGRDPLEIFKDLYKQCGENMEIAKNAIIVIDEIDKLRESTGVEKDVSGAGVIETFLSYLSGIKAPIKDNYDNIRAYLPTDNIKFIFLGAFEGYNGSDSLYKIREKRLEKKSSIGFCNDSSKNEEYYNKEFISDDLKAYGFSRQFTGRIKIIELNDLSDNDLLNIIFNSKISVFRAYEREFASYGVKMEYSDALITKLVEHAKKQNEGARGLIDACDDAFLKALEELEGMKVVPYSKVCFGDNVLKDHKDYKFE